MAQSPPARPHRVLIVSSHPLFRDGLHSLLQARQADVEVVGLVRSTEEAVVALQRLRPDLVIVDYDDAVVNRDEFLARFTEGAFSVEATLCRACV